MLSEKRKLDNVKEMVAELMDKLHDAHFVTDVSYGVEEIYCTLDLDITFTMKEVKAFTDDGYKVNKDKTRATKKYDGYPVTVEKSGYDQFEFVIGDYVDTTFTIEECMTKTKAFKAFFKHHVKEYVE